MIVTVRSASSVVPTTPLHHGEEQRPEQTSEANPKADRRRRCEGGFGTEEEHPLYRDALSEKAEAAAAGSSGEREGRTHLPSSISEKESQTAGAGAAATAAPHPYRLELQVPTRWLCKL